MKMTLIATLLMLSTLPSLARGQAIGNVGYSRTGGNAAGGQRAVRVLTKEEMPPTSTSMFIEANVLLNVKADEYVAVFGIVQEGETLADCSQKMDATLKAFAADLKSLKISDDDVYVDFITQNRIYGYQLKGDILEEKLVGFELKKNVSIHYKDPSQLEKLTLAAARSQVFDLIKVDYILTETSGIQDKLMDEAARIAKNKLSRYEKLLGLKLQPPAQIYAQKFALHYPTQMYDSYTASESEDVRGNPDRRYTIKSARKNRTHYFNALDGDGFDLVLNPVITEPVVQCTLYLKVKYEIEQPKAK